MGCQSIENRKPVKCEHCEKLLLFRLDDGVLEFVFGKPKKKKNINNIFVQNEAPVQMKIKGIIKMRCFRKSCSKWNVIASFKKK